MKNAASQLISTLLLVAILFAPASGRARAQTPSQQQTTPARQTQQPAPTPRATPDPEDDVVRITTNLVQIDAVVLDREGRQVTDLTPADFEILEDDKQQQITNFSYVTVETPAVGAEAEAAKKPADSKTVGPAAPVPPARLKPGAVRRTVALVVDDLGTSFESIAQVRTALKKYVDEQMQPGDLVAIMRTSAGMGALQQFTTDKRLLYRAIERVRWYPAGRAGISAFAPIEPDPAQQVRDELNNTRGGTSEAERERQQSAGSLDEFREEIFSVGTLGALNFIVRGLRELPGRKSIVLFSDGFEIFNQEGQSARILQALQRLTDLANRASVVIYTIDARGLVTLGLNAADNTSGLTPDQIEQRIGDRRLRLFNTQDGMNYLAQQTGGFFVRNSNDLAGGVRRILDDQKGFYLIGYRPDEETFDPARGRGRFNKIEIKVKRPGLKVRTRRGFYGFTEEEAARPAARTRAEQLLAAISSPFASGELPLKLTSLFSSEGEKQNFISTLLHIDSSKFAFTEEADGWRKAVFDIIAFTFGESGNVIDTVNRTETLRVRGEAYDEVLRYGLVYTMKVPVKKPGAYQLRIALRDTTSERVGSASQLVEVPNLGNDRLALSGIVMSGTETKAGAAGAQTADFDPMATPSVRRFRQGSSVDYLLHIYNAKTDRATGRPQLQYQVRLFREGQQVYAGNLVNYDPEKQTNMKLLMVAGRLRLGTALPPGEYVFQIVVYDLLAKEKHRMATQWIEFEVVK